MVTVSLKLALELINHMLQASSFIFTSNQKEIDEAAEKVHGISSAFLADKPVFADIVEEFWPLFKMM